MLRHAYDRITATRRSRHKRPTIHTSHTDQTAKLELDGNGQQFSLPLGWTDAAEPDVFVTMAAGRSPFRFADLVALRRLIDGLSD